MSWGREGGDLAVRRPWRSCLLDTMYTPTDLTPRKTLGLQSRAEPMQSTRFGCPRNAMCACDTIGGFPIAAHIKRHLLEARRRVCGDCQRQMRRERWCSEFNTAQEKRSRHIDISKQLYTFQLQSSASLCEWLRLRNPFFRGAVVRHLWVAETRPLVEQVSTLRCNLKLAEGGFEGRRSRCDWLSVSAGPAEAALSRHSVKGSSVPRVPPHRASASLPGLSLDRDLGGSNSSPSVRPSCGLPRERSEARPRAGWMVMGKRGRPSALEVCRVLAVFLSLFPSVSLQCKILKCNSEFWASTSNSGPEEEFCTALRAYNSCVRRTARTCRGDLAYHSAQHGIEDLMSQHNCSKEGPTSQPRARTPLPPLAPPLLPDSQERSDGPEMCHYERSLPRNTSPPNYTHCGFFGDPHLRTFGDDFQTCKVEGAWPLIHNKYLSVQVTNTPVVPGSLATATSKMKKPSPGTIAKILKAL
ncbi:unnamed protein product [Pleuronectes platessa]|uniref:Uncharacterized protein n=1 Tax=Pleuronectes platessa TaxID=8262 RepID=A0A9N7TMG0_PLEPL|nr:unnamed protein product [Pleuronectes platessa]